MRVFGDMNRQKTKLLIEECRYEKNVDIQIELLYEINMQLSTLEKLHLPSFITNDYVQRALDIIEERLSGNQVPTAVAACRDV
jgi:hypothetical protein